MAKTRLEITRQERLHKLQQIRDLGINPFPAQSQKDLFNQKVISDFDKLEGKSVSLTGRLMSFREHGKIAFGDLQDQSGKIQLYLRQDVLEPVNVSQQTLGFSELKLIDPGDFLQATGEVTKTQSGQISILVKKLKLLTKALRPLPSNQDILTDPETIFRRRYLDLMLNPDHHQLFIRKAKFWQVQRQFMHDHGFMEIETPVLEHVTGGADARPFITHMNSLDQNFFLRISTELYQKRLIGGGYEKIFTLAPNFRNEGLSDEHLNEYYQLEWYWAYADYQDNMRLVQELFQTTAQQVYGSTQFTRGEHHFDLAGDWPQVSYPDIIREKLGIDIFNSSDADMLKVIKDQGIKLSGTVNRSRLIDNIWKIIRKNITGPAFLVNEPKFMSPLAKSKQDDPNITERFHIIIAGSELGNGYSELNDPVDQLERFQEQQAARDAGDGEAQMMDIDFVEMLEYGMPPTSGYAHSERLFWFLENISAREGTLFPALRNKVDPLTQKIYSIDGPQTIPDSTSLPDEHNQRFVAILNKKIPAGKAFNALGHMTAGLAGGHPNPQQLHLLQYQDKDETIHPNISHFPFIILQADNSNQIRKVREEAKKHGITFTDFTSTMTIGTSQEQQDATQNTPESELEYYGICLFGNTDTIKQFTKQFSIYK